MTTVKIIDATQALAAGRKVPASGRAVVATSDDKVIAIAGYAHDGGRLLFWGDVDPAMRDHFGFALARAAVRLMREAAATGLPIQACPDPQVPKAARLLEWLGFRPLTAEVWQWQRPTT